MSRYFRLALYTLGFAFLDAFPVSSYGRGPVERGRQLLTSLRSCVSSFFNIVTITVLVITVAVVAALQSGAVHWLRQYVEDSRMARTVEISSAFGTQVNLFGAETLEGIRALEIEGAPDAIEAVHGWNDVTFWFIDRNGAKDDTLTHGRTVDPADPLLADLRFEGGFDGFEGDGTAQAIVSLPLLRSLGYPPGSSPEVIHLDYYDSRAPVRIVGVCEQTPAGDFLITEIFNRRINDRQWDPDPRVPGLYWGPVTPSDALDAALADLAPYLDGRRIGVGWELVWRAGNQRWIELTRADAWTRQQWRDILLPVVAERLGAVMQGARHEFFEPLPTTIPPRSTLETRFTRASIYVASLEAVPRVADALAAEGYKVTSSSRELALLFLQISSLGRGVLLTVIAVVGVLAAISLGLSFVQNIQQKTHEIAILKAFGASNRIVLGVYLLKAVILWAISVALGLAVVGRIARVVDTQLIDLLRLQGLLDLGGAGSSVVRLSAPTLFAVAGGSLTLCCLATLLAGMIAVSLQPASALSLHR